MSRLRLLLLPIAAFLSLASACSDCYSTQPSVIQTRHVRRSQPEALNATSGPKSALEWGEINFLHTTDTHGWLEGHLKEPNYGADWGDFVSFTKAMRKKARWLEVDLLLIDTGDLHDGDGLSDATDPNGLLSNPVFENIDYDLLTIGNHELYISSISYEHYNQFAKVYGERYLTSNVQILDPSTGKFEYVGAQYRYFTTEQGLRIMAFGVLYDFTGNSNATKIIKASTMVKQQWFLDAVNFTQPIDLYLVLGHNPVRTSVSSSTLGTIYQAIRKENPDTPIQFFGGHTHVRDFFVYDNKATGLESGRYCETVGWLSISGLTDSGYESSKVLTSVPTPTQSAVVVATKIANLSLSKTPSSLRYSRRYLDWNRLTFEYHASGSQSSFDTQQGRAVTSQITADRQQLNLSSLYGCAPQTWCQSCRKFGDSGNIFTLLSEALSTVVVNTTRATTPRLIIINTGSVRFDLPKGPFTYDDSFIVSPFTDAFQFIPDVPYSAASKVLGILNSGPFQKKRRDLSGSDFNFQPLTLLNAHESCENPPIPAFDDLSRRSVSAMPLVKRQTAASPGYTTVDDFGTDGDDTLHTRIPYFTQPNDLQANASFPTDGSMPATVDIVFLDFIASYVISALNQSGASYKSSDVSYYLPQEFTTNSYLPEYAKLKWQAGVPNCPLGTGIGGS